MKRKSELKQINSLIAYYFGLPKGHRISHPNIKMFIDDAVRISRRAIKHIVEERRDDTYTIAQIQGMFTKILETVHNPDFSISNNNKKYPGSFMTVKSYQKLNNMLVVVQNKNSSGVAIITVFFRQYRHYKKMKAKSQ